MYTKENAAAIAKRKSAVWAENKDAHSARRKLQRQVDGDTERAQKRAQHAARREEYNERSRQYYRDNKEARSAHMKTYRRENPDVVRRLGAKHRALKIQASPPWVDYEKIAEFYEDARTLETIFGWPFHVDHVVPLNHPLVSGLHVPANLQILSASENQSKSNTFHI
jgi:hypothetical protein